MNGHQLNTATGLKMWLGTRRRLSSAASVVALLPVLGAVLTGGALAGDALYTTTKDGTAVNANIYPTSTDVYISGGPQNKKAAGLPDGTYYFQVTDPSGGTLLSTDPAICRQVTVVGGHIDGSSGPPCEHTDGTPNTANGTTPVQLFPFSPTPNSGNEYKAWLIAQTPGTSVSPSDPKVLIFSNSDAKTDNFKVQKAITPPPQGSCQGGGSLAALVTGFNVVAYVPKGTWDIDTPGVSAVNVEGSSITNTLIPTAPLTGVNSCAANSVTKQIVCTANHTNVYLISGTSLNATLTSGGGPGKINFSGGSCINCNVSMDAVHNKAIIGLSIGGKAGNFDGTPGFQVLDLSTSTFGPLFASPAGAISEGMLFDPTRNFLLSAVEAENTPSENNDFEIVDLTNSAAPKFYENDLTSVPSVPPFTDLDSTSAECSTGIAVAPAEFTDPSQVVIADLSQIKLTSGTPGTWTAPSQFQTLSESSLSAGASGSAIAQETHTGIITGEFGDDTVTAIKLPATSGSGTPAITDWVTCHVGRGFQNGDDPHTVTAYQSPNTGDAIAILANEGANTLAVVDLTQMLNTTIVPRTSGSGLGHACSAGTLPASVVTFIVVP
jgi:hypothetical protein